MRVTQDDVSFDELGNAGDERSLESKLRAALTKYTTGDSYDKHRDLVDLLLSKSEEHQKLGRQLKGRPMFHIARGFYEVRRDNKRIAYELRATIDNGWLGDSLSGKTIGTTWSATSAAL